MRNLFLLIIMLSIASIGGCDNQNKSKSSVISEHDTELPILNEEISVKDNYLRLFKSSPDSLCLYSDTIILSFGTTTFPVQFFHLCDRIKTTHPTFFKQSYHYSINNFDGKVGISLNHVIEKLEDEFPNMKNSARLFYEENDVSADLFVQDLIKIIELDSEIEDNLNLIFQGIGREDAFSNVKLINDILLSLGQQNLGSINFNIILVY